MPPTSSVVVIGAGVVGLCTAWNLVHTGADVTVVSNLDPEREIGWGSGAWVNASSKVRLGYPDHYTVLNQHGMTALHHLAEKLDTERWLHTTGAIEIVTGAEQRQRLAADVARLIEFDYPAEMLDAGGAARLMPGVRLGDDETAAIFPTEAWIDVSVLLTTLTAAITEAGGRFIRRTVTGFAEEAGAVTGVRLDDDSILAVDRYVIAAGAWTGQLAALAGLDVPLLPATHPKVPGLVVAVTNPSRELRPIILAPEVIVRPFGPSKALLAGDGHGVALTIDSPRSELIAAAEVLLERAATRIPALAGSVILDVRLSLRAIPSDGITIAGFPDRSDNVYVLTTHSGFSLAAVIGDLAAREILTGQKQEALRPYRPSRFSPGDTVTAPARADSASA
ncbi:NAD(P)/FAD-dependent oxidoreductase [Mycobacterium sp. NPDC003449]